MGRCSLLLSLVVAEVLSQSSLVPPPNCLLLQCWEEQPSLARPCCSHSIFDMTQVSFACEKPWSCSGCCQSWSQIPDPTSRDAAGHCALRARVLVFESSFSTDESLRSKAICWHALSATNTGVWVTRERLFKESKRNQLHCRQRPYMLCVFACIVLCICFANYGISLPLAHHDLIGFKCRAVAYGLNVSRIIINEN